MTRHEYRPPRQHRVPACALLVQTLGKRRSLAHARPASGNALGQRAVTAAEIEYGLVGRWGEKIQNLGAKVRDETRNCARIRLRPMLAPRRRIGHIAEDIRNKRPRARPFVSAEGR